MGTKIPHLLFQNNLLCSLIKENYKGEEERCWEPICIQP